MSEPTAPVDGFTEALPFTADTVGLAPAASGVHVVRDSDGAPIYVGATGDLRGRLRQHLSGDRQASVLHEQVGAELDDPESAASCGDTRKQLRPVRSSSPERNQPASRALPPGAAPVE